ncbi:bifunctional metallophosphatase/5'-nucleotidase [Halorarum salinum]|uniref:Bifunctional metallophosphatase/5'-nucleotidase n=1 Tax=Halorarum salinum TaxID=2743089 RepID=A0A7D5QJE6_9EURY|nr:bifunctional metallophosphatase/5'-nucleotidase [Halobaculum salinum]
MLRAGGVALGSGALSGVASADEPTTLTVLSYNDVQTAAAEDGDFPRLVTLIEERRAAADGPVVVVGGGDQVGPHALGPVSQWRAPVDVLNHVEPDADVIGNHEFDYGFDEVSAFTEASEFPWLATNVVDESGESFDGTESHEIVERGGVRVGLIGLVDEGATYGKTNIDFEAEGVTVADYTEVGPETARTLKEEEGVDAVVALAHTGVPDAEALAEADADDHIDVVVAGDDEIRYPPAETSGTVVTEGVARARYLGELELTVEDGEVVDWDGRLIGVTDDVPKDPTASEIVASYRDEAKLDTVVATTETPLDARFSTNYHRESNYGNLVTDAMRERTGADVAITNAGGIRSDGVYGPGEITGGDVFNTLPFANTLVTVELTGAELVEALASQVVTMESDTGQNFGAEISQQVSGVRFEWVPHEDVEERIRDVYVGGEPLDPEATYAVAVNSFIADGGSGYPLADEPALEETDELLATTVVEYLDAEGTVAPPVGGEGRMQRVDRDLADAEVTTDGNGKVVCRFDAPADVESVAGDATTVWTKGTGRVEADGAVFDESDGTLVVRVDDGELSDLVEGAEDGETAPLDLYVGYESAEYDRVYFEHSRLNADVEATVREDGRRGRVEAGSAL